MKERPEVKACLAQAHAGSFEQFLMTFEALKAAGLTLEDVNYERSGDHLLHVLCKTGKLDVLKYLKQDFGADKFDPLARRVKNLEAKTLLHESAQFCQPEVTQFLIDLKCEVNALKRADWTPLMLACTKKNNLKVVKILIEGQADLDLVNKDGWNAFHLAAREGDVDIMKFLLEKSPNCHKTVSKNGRTPLHSAALAGDRECLQYLLSLEHDRDVTDTCGSTPLMDCARKGFKDNIRLFVDKGHSLKALDTFGRDVLIVAAHAGEAQVVQDLVQDYMLDPNFKDFKGMTALHWAALEGQSKAIQGLLDLKADRTLKDDKGRKAEDIARDAKHEETVKVLQQNL